MNVLITGGCGFQGSHLAEALLNKGHFVRILNTPSEHARENYELYLKRYNNLEIVWGSVMDRDLLDHCMRDVERVFHLGAKINVDESIQRPLDYLETNYQGTKNVLDNAVKHRSQVIHASTCEVYGENLFGTLNVLESVKKYRPGLQFVSTAAVYGEGSEIRMNEWHPLRPTSPYAASKAAADRLCYCYYKTHKLDITIVRPFNIYGERQKRTGFGAVIPIFFEKALSHQDITIFGDGTQTRDYLHVSDIVRAYILIAETKDLIGKEVNAGSGIERRVIDIAEKITDISGARRSIIKFVGERKGEVNSFIADNALIEQYGFAPAKDFDRGLKEYHEWRLAQIMRDYEAETAKLKNTSQTPPL
jgi:dTDP-glucose 4,6-dehydratase